MASPSPASPSAAGFGSPTRRIERPSPFLSDGQRPPRVGLPEGVEGVDSFPGEEVERAVAVPDQDHVAGR